MSRIVRTEAESVGSDSFLDVVTNIVGILIILVMVVGIRVQKSPATVADPTPPVDLNGPRAEAAALERDILALEAQAQQLAQTSSERGAERNQLAFLVAQQERELALRREDLDKRAQDDFDLRRSLSLAEANLARIQSEIEDRAAKTKHTPIEIKCYPTPLSQTVLGKEAHFQLRQGRIAYIPLDELVELFRQQAKQKIYKLRELREITETVGPLGGFRLRYTLERVDLSTETQMQTKMGASFARLFEYTVIPVSSQLGERLSEALADRSEFRTALGDFKPRQTTVTLWTYEDSFAEYRALKEELYRLGYAVAGRPLPDGLPIGGSPQGSQSAAQ